MEDKKYTGHLVFLFLMTSNVNEVRRESEIYLV